MLQYNALYKPNSDVLQPAGNSLRIVGNGAVIPGEKFFEPCKQQSQRVFNAPPKKMVPMAGNLGYGKRHDTDHYYISQIWPKDEKPIAYTSMPPPPEFKRQNETHFRFDVASWKRPVKGAQAFGPRPAPTVPALPLGWQGKTSSNPSSSLSLRPQTTSRLQTAPAESLPEHVPSKPYQTAAQQDTAYVRSNTPAHYQAAALHPATRHTRPWQTTSMSHAALQEKAFSKTLGASSSKTSSSSRPLSRAGEGAMRCVTTAPSGSSSFSSFGSSTSSFPKRKPNYLDTYF